MSSVDFPTLTNGKIDKSVVPDSVNAAVERNFQLASRMMRLYSQANAGEKFNVFTASGAGGVSLIWRFDNVIVPGNEPTYTWPTNGPHTITVDRLDGLDLKLDLHTNDLAATDIASIAIPQSLTYTLHLGYTGLYGDVTAAAIPQGLSGTLALYSNNLTGDLGELRLPQGLSSGLNLNENQFTGDVARIGIPPGLTTSLLLDTNAQLAGDMANMILPTALTDRLHLSNTAIYGILDIGSVPGVRDVGLQPSAMTRADIDATIGNIYTDRASFTNAAPSLNIGGSNPTPSGTYQYAATPSTALEKVYALVNDDDAEGFNKWTITYTGQ